MISDSSPEARGQVLPQVHPADDGVMRGRDAERQVVRGLLRRAQRGLGGVVLVEGEPGIGKSRLLREATDEAARQGFSLAAGAADQLGRAIPFFALRAPLAVMVAICRMPLRGGSARYEGTWSSGLRLLRFWCAWMTCSGRARPRWRRCGHCRGN
jgi:hypothetical protein